MKKLSAILIYFLISILIFSCTEDRDLLDNTNQGQNPNPNPDPNPLTIQAGVLKINEFVARGSTNPNEFGSNEDWFEIYNPNDEALTLEQGKWFVTDDLTDQEKFEVPISVTIPAKGFLVIWCDNATGGNDIHATFGLSGGGEEIGIYYKQDDNSMLEIDSYTYGSQTDGVSEGRSPDGADNWTNFNSPTIGTTNN